MKNSYTVTLLIVTILASAYWVFTLLSKNNDSIAEDKSSIKSIDTEIKNQNVVSEIEKQTNENIGDPFPYRRDEKQVYFSTDMDNFVLKGADSKTFTYVYDTEGEIVDWYGKDIKNVFFGQSLIKSADPKTFVKIASSTFSKDANYVFSEENQGVYAVGIMQGADPKQFVPLLTPEGKISRYGKIGDTIFCAFGPLKEADPLTFTVTSEFFAKDKNSSYQECDIALRG